MTAQTERRRRLKNRKRGRVAQPSITLGREMIPGVPAFHEGGIVHNQFHTALGGGQQSPSQPPPDPGAMRQIDFVARRLGISPQEAAGFLGIVAGRDEGGLGLGSQAQVFEMLFGGGGGGAAAPQWRPGEFGLQERGLALQEESQALQAEIQRANLELQQQIANQQHELARQTEARIREMENRRIQLDQQSLQLQRELGFGGLDLQRELGLMGGALTGRGQDVTQRGQDINAMMAQMDLGVEARGQDVTMRGQDIAAQMQANQQQIGLFEQQRLQAEARGELQLARDIEERQRALQRQNAALQQHQASLASAGLGIEAQRGAGGQMGQLAMGLGNIEARRAEFLSKLAANPRDFMQLQFAMGGGQNFINQLMAGKPITGQSTAQIGGTPTLGPGFERLVGEVTQRRDLPFFEEARGMTRGLAQMGQNVPQAPSLALLQMLGRMPGQGAMPAPIAPPTLTAPNLPQVGAPDLGLNMPKPIAPVPMAGGGQMVTDEPVLGIGMLSGQKKFTLGEPAPGFPFGKPEKMEITPFQQGGSVMAGSFATNPSKKPPLKFGGLVAPTRTQATPTAVAKPAPAPIRAPTAAPAPATTARAAAAPKPPAPSPVQITINAAGQAPTLASTPVAAGQGGSGALPWPNPPGGGGEFTGPWPVDVPKIDPVTGNPINIGPDGRPYIIDPRTGEMIRPWTPLPWPGFPGLPPGFTMPIPGQPLPPGWEPAIQTPHPSPEEHPASEATLRLRETLGPFLNTRNVAPPAPVAPPAGPVPSGMSVGQFIRQLMSGLTARSYAGLTQTQRDLIDSITSALGLPRGSVFESVEKTFPTGINPAGISMGTNFGQGGTIIAPSWSSQSVA